MSVSFAYSDLLDTLPGLLLGLSAAVCCLLLSCGAVWVIYFLLTLPIRRNERARLFVDMLELGLSHGHTPENAVVDASWSRDHALGARFHLLAAIIEQGQSLGTALSAVPRVVPPEVAAMVRTGERLGDLRLVLPACRKILQDSVSQVNGALNYILLVNFVFSPAVVALLFTLKFNVIPAFEGVFSAMSDSALPAFSNFVFVNLQAFIFMLALMAVLLWVLALAYIAGPRLRTALRRAAPHAVDTFLYWLPWRRKRLQRNFAQLLMLLLDAGVPELQALKLAADSAGNLVVLERAARAAEALARGVRLPDAIQAMEEAKDVRWRLKNALAGEGGFGKALAGWFQALDAKADQQEQAVAQLVTTGLVLLNGFIVGLTAAAVYLVLIQLIQEATLW